MRCACGAVGGFCTSNIIVMLCSTPAECICMYLRAILVTISRSRRLMLWLCISNASVGNVRFDAHACSDGEISSHLCERGVQLFQRASFAERCLTPAPGITEHHFNPERRTVRSRLLLCFQFPSAVFLSSTPPQRTAPPTVRVGNPSLRRDCPCCLPLFPSFHFDFTVLYPSSTCCPC